MDFTLKIYKLLLNTLLHRGYSFQTFSQYIIEKKKSLPVTDHRLLLLRHDVEARYEQALQFAKIQNQLGIKGTYFFRLLPKSFKPEIVKQIADLGHETGYHYDDLTQCKGDYEKAIVRFEKNLQTLRDIAPVQTICMDGSPLSKYDNKLLWKYYNYKDYGIIGEPYFDVDFSEVLYLTDTGRRWDGEKVSIRDKVKTSMREDIPLESRKLSGKGERGEIYNYKKTHDIIKAAENSELPDLIMFTFHPQRWTNKPLSWVKELVLQNLKNQVKRVLVKRRRNEK